MCKQIHFFEKKRLYHFYRESDFPLVSIWSPFVRHLVAYYEAAVFYGGKVKICWRFLAKKSWEEATGDWQVMWNKRVDTWQLKNNSSWLVFQCWLLLGHESWRGLLDRIFCFLNTWKFNESFNENIEQRGMLLRLVTFQIWHHHPWHPETHLLRR